METLEKLIYDLYKKNARQCTDEEIYNALLIYTKNQLFERGYQDGKKKIYYISAEFLIGKLLSNNLINLGIYDDVAKFLKENGKEIAAIEEVEPEPSLGNGGLGRLAACFLDSIATLGLPGEGIGLNYHLGLFKQLFENRLQKETPNPWIEEHSWLTPAGVSYTVPFRGFSLKSSLYDIDVAGYNNKSIHLHLFDIDLADESMVHDGISFNKKDILHNLTLFLYPDDSDDDGRKLRIFQQYFMVSNAAQFILDEATKKGCNLHDLADYAVIQINDTHPSMVIPELIRLLTKRGIAFDEAAEIVSKVCAYTNHTILAEALEKYQLRETEPMRILCSVGGLDIAGLCGVFLGGAKYHMPIVADGVISAVAALTAERLCPGTKEFIIPSHKGKEPASELLMRELGLSPVLDAELALGEGTGAVMMFSLLDIAMSLYETGATFGDFKIEEYHRF